MPTTLLNGELVSHAIYLDHTQFLFINSNILFGQGHQSADIGLICFVNPLKILYFRLALAFFILYFLTLLNILNFIYLGYSTFRILMNQEYVYQLQIHIHCIALLKSESIFGIILYSYYKCNNIYSKSYSTFRWML